MMLLRNDGNEDGTYLSLVIKVKDDVSLSVTQAYPDYDNNMFKMHK